MEPNNVAMIGGGRRAARFAAGLIANLPGPCRLRVHVPPAQVRVTTERVAEVLGATSSPVDWQVVAEAQVQDDTQLVFETIGRTIQPTAGLADRSLLREYYCSRLQPEAIVLAHTAEFPEVAAPCPTRPSHGLFHFLHPADVISLVEVGMSGFSADERRSVTGFLQAANYFPLVQERWKSGFLSNRFQVLLLEAIGRLLAAPEAVTEDMCKRIDKAIAAVVRQLHRAARSCSSGDGIFDAVAAKKEKFLELEPDFAPLWEVFATVWDELRPYWSEREVALGLLAGPALRCLYPGFLRTVDMLGIPPFAGLTSRVCPNGSQDIFYLLMSNGRTGPAEPYPVGWSGERYVDGGFYPRTPELEYRAMQDRQHRFFKRHRVTVSK